MLATIFIVFLALLGVTEAGLPNPGWSTNCQSGFTHCADVKVYSDWAKESSEQIMFHIDAYLHDPIDSVTVWLLHDGRLKDSEEVAKTLWREAVVSVILVHPRGGYGGSPSLRCDGSTSDGWPDAKCAGSVTADKLGMNAFSTTQVAKDLDWLLGHFNKGKMNVIVGQGVNSLAVLRLLQTSSTRGGEAYVIAGGVSPPHFDVYAQLHQHVEYALHTVLRACEREMQCAGRLGATEGATSRLNNVLQSLKEDTLPCGHQLGWSKKSSDTYGLVVELLYRLVAQTPLVVSSEPALVSVLPSVLYRLQRCTVEDMKALTFLRNYVNKLVGSNKAIESSTVLQQFNWLVNELSSPGTMKAVDIKKLDKSPPSAFASTALLGRYKTVYDGFPRYSITDTIKDTPNKLLLLAADSDPTYSLPQFTGLAALHEKVLHNTAHTCVVAGSSQLPLHRPRHLSCLLLHIKQYKANQRWAAATACATDNGNGRPNDDANAAEGIEFTDEGSAFNFIHVNAEAYYGGKDAWEFTVPQAAEPPGGRQPRSVWSKVWTVIKTLFLIVVILAVVYGLYLFLSERCRNSGVGNLFPFSSNADPVSNNFAVSVEDEVTDFPYDNAARQGTSSGGWSLSSVVASVKGRLFPDRPDPTARPELNDDDDDDFFTQIRR
ncbi:hypothetical protein ADEAN_000345600 [Angomonas deanei]|uniref:Alpha/beta hydrolase family n=1 Tax=Angomonas deanei TaxID=59799 RepID=A0A7G2C868_9TRYP|nr:hypothetical protein ADEAN_000345600 [Angomonas deanei]